MKNIVAALLITTASLSFASKASFAEDAHIAPVTAYLNENVAPWVNDPAIIAAIRAQNTEHASLSEGDIDTLDKKWRAEVEGTDHPMIDGVLSNAVSKLLKEKQAESKGAIAEVFVMDNKGLNVGQSDPTSDYWQGDEAKFQKSFGAGKDGLFVDEIEKDESTQALQSQASMTINDEAGTPIGAITVGINLDAL
ncbi:MAG: PDC sensor domain-containing protein [Allorhizobium sp.]